MKTKKEYEDAKRQLKEAQEVIGTYELDLVHKDESKKCWILNIAGQWDKDSVFVTTNEEYADKIYSTGKYAIMCANLIKP